MNEHEPLKVIGDRLYAEGEVFVVVAFLPVAQRVVCRPVGDLRRIRTEPVDLLVWDRGLGAWLLMEPEDAAEEAESWES